MSDEFNERIKIRRLQALTGERSLTLVFPKRFASELGIGRGDYLKCYIERNRLIVEKIDRRKDRSVMPINKKSIIICSNSRQRYNEKWAYFI
jgi:bifunctional DNA-binding transcriptional regulator/antitoxin component of YhaV-PrlF toxin-antitoxin module